MLLLLPCIQASIRLFRLSYERNWENTIETRCMFEFFLMKRYSILLYEKSYPLFILSYSISRKKTIKLKASWFISVSWIRDWNRWNSDMSRICYVFQILRTSSKNRVIWSSWWYRVKNSERYGVELTFMLRDFSPLLSFYRGIIVTVM